MVDQTDEEWNPHHKIDLWLLSSHFISPPSQHTPLLCCRRQRTAMATTLVPVPSLNSHTIRLSHRRPLHTFHATPRSVSHIALCSSSSVVVEQQNQQNEVTASSPPSSSDDLPPGVCKACGKTEVERGCNGNGRIQGGIATVPGFGWWPIKAYRPCPAFVASGGRYTRQGQSMDEVAFGRGGRDSPTASNEPPSRKKSKESKR